MATLYTLLWKQAICLILWREEGKRYNDYMDEDDPYEAAVQAHLQRYGLNIEASAAPAVRTILAEQTALTFYSNTQLMHLCCVELFWLAQPDDILRIWQAKQSSFDASCGIEVQLLCGTGLEETLRFLRESPLPEAQEPLTYLSECQDTGDFKGFSPADQFRFYEEYYSE